MRSFRLSLPLAVLVLGSSAAGQQGPGGSANRAISGTVYDGVTRQPIAGVVVSHSGNVGDARVTDEKGRFVFDAIGHDDFVGRTPFLTLTAQKSGYLESEFGIDRAVLGSVGNGSVSASGHHILLAAGQWLEGADLTLWPAASVSGTVTDEYGEPFVDQLVRVLASDPVAGHRRWSHVETVVTDDRGRYFAGRLAPGRYVIVAPAAVPPESSAAVRPGRYYPDALRLADARPVVVAAGARLTGLDIARLPAPASRVSGRVTGASTGSWPPLLLALTVAGDPDIGPMGYVATALLEPKGTFVFPRVPPGAYVIRTSPSMTQDSAPIQTYTFGPSQLPLSLAAPRGLLPAAALRGWSLAAPTDAVSAPYFAHTPVTVGEADVPNVAVALEHAVRLSGVLTADDPAVMPRLFAEPADPDAGPASQTSQVDPTGAFVIDGLAPGAYFLRSGTPFRVEFRSIRVGGRELVDQPIDVSKSVAGISITTTAVSSIHGDVRAGSTRASARTAVIYFPSDRQLWPQVSSKSARFGRVFVNTDGKYDTFPTLPGGQYYIVAIPPNAGFEGWRSEAFLGTAARVATTVRLDWAQRLQQDLQLQEVRLP